MRSAVVFAVVFAANCVLLYSAWIWLPWLFPAFVAWALASLAVFVRQLALP